jgi:hypothetical protein
MQPEQLSRRALIYRGATAVAVAAVGLEAVSGAAAASSPTGEQVVVGLFAGAESDRVGLLQPLDGGAITRVSLDPEAFVAHGADGVVEGLGTFLEGEKVIASGTAAGGDFVAIDFQSIYTCVAGIVETTEGSYRLKISSGESLEIPAKVASLDAPSGLEDGSSYGATIWTNPDSGATTILDIAERG